MAAASRFSVPLGEIAARANASLETVARKATLDLFRSVVMKSPVDSGRFKANWNVSYGSPDPAVTANKNAGRGLEQAAMSSTLPLGGIVYLANGLPYARRLEYGWSKQAPSGMVRLSALEFDQSIREAIAS